MNKRQLNRLPSIQFYLDTELKYFSQWVAEKTSNAPAKRFPYKKGHIGLLKARGKEKIFGKSVIQMDGFYITRGKLNSDLEDQQPLGSVIEFTISTPSPTRLEVTAKCGQPACLEYFVEILTWIKQAYPESRKNIEEFLTKLPEMEDVETEHTQAEEVSKEYDTELASEMSSEELLDRLHELVRAMKEFNSACSYVCTKAIIENLHKAYERSNYGEVTADLLAQFCNRTNTTISRHLSAMRKVGIEKIDNIEI